MPRIRNTSRPVAIVTDGLWRKSLSAIRSLGKAGFEVHVFGESVFTIGFWSRYTSRRVLAPTAERDPEGFGRALLAHLRKLTPDGAELSDAKLSDAKLSGAELSGAELLDREGIQPAAVRPPVVLLPMEDATLRWVSRNRGALARGGYANLLIPSEDSLKVAFDKSRTIELAKQLGLPAPETAHPRSLEEFLDAIHRFTGAGAEASDPSGGIFHRGTARKKTASSFRPAATDLADFVVKPCTGSGSAGVRYGAPLPGESWESYWNKHGPALVQERVPSDGRAVGVSLLFDHESRCIAHFTHERIRQYPVSGGPSTDRRSIHAPPLLKQSIRLLEALQWQGVAMVEWKNDPRDGTPKLMEINPRFWGSLELAVRADVNFPTLYARKAIQSAKPTYASPPELAVTSELAVPAEYPDGVRCRWMIPGEVLRWLSESPADRESPREFFSHLSTAEEWDHTDLRGTLAVLICTAALSLNPRYWKFLRRG